MFKGSCLCGEVKFAVRNVCGPTEICHCNRCRKTSGTNSLTSVGLRTEDFSLLQGQAFIRTYAAPILYSPPAYLAHFCSKCGSPVPVAPKDGELMEIPLGIFDDDPGVKPDKHIFVEFVPAWDKISDNLPQYKIQDLVRERGNRELPEDFKLKSHYDVPSRQK